jgi:GntR family transcriptional regulator
MPWAGFKIDYERGVPLYRQIVEAIRIAVNSDDLEPGQQLPTIHELAAELCINPNTVARAYRELEASGYLSGRRGQGTFVSDEKVPAPVAPKGKERQRILRAIYREAIAHGARYSLTPAEIVRHFQRAIDEST